MDHPTFAFEQLAPPAPPPPPPDPLDPEQLVAEARAEGYEAGRRDGTAEAQARLAAVDELVGSLGRELARERAEVAERTERAAVELALRIAEQALGAAVAVQPERVLDVLRGALRRLVERERVTLLVHPDDLELVREHAAELVAELGGVEHCEVQAERRVAPGGAIVRTAEGEIDARLQTKLERAREVLEAALVAGSD